MMHLAPYWSETLHWSHRVLLWYVIVINVILTFQSCTSHYNAGTWGIVQGQLRPLLAPRVYTLPMVRSIGKTMVQGKNYGPQITVKRISTRSVSHCVCCWSWFDRFDSTTHFCNKQKRHRATWSKPENHPTLIQSSRNTFSSVMISHWLAWI